jgi:hypothetical protein
MAFPHSELAGGCCHCCFLNRSLVTATPPEHPTELCPKGFIVRTDHCKMKPLKRRYKCPWILSLRCRRAHGSGARCWTGSRSKSSGLCAGHENSGFPRSSRSSNSSQIVIVSHFYSMTSDRRALKKDGSPVGSCFSSRTGVV